MFSAKIFVRAVTGAVVVAFGLANAGSAPAADFYKGKRIQVLIGSGAGGGYDTYARLLSRHMGRLIPGNPTFLPKNMVGASSITAANYIVNVAPKDGTFIGALQREIALVQLLGQPGPKFKAQELNWLGSMTSEPGVCAIATHTGVKSFADVFKRQFVVGGTGPNITEFHPAMLNNLLGAKFKLIKGYPSTPPVHLAIERGEVDGICQSWASFQEQSAEMLKKGTIKPLVQMSLKPQAEMQKRGVPMIFDFVTKDTAAPGFTPDDVKSYFKIVLSSSFMGRPYAVAPGVPADRVKLLRTAFEAVTRDKKFLAEAAKQRRDISLVTGDDIQQLIEQMASTPKEKLAKVDDLMKFKGQTAKAVIKMVRHTGKVTKTKSKGRKITIKYKGKNVSASISGSGTKVTINGKKGKRGAVKVGMTCTFFYAGSGTPAKELDCKG